MNHTSTANMADMQIQLAIAKAALQTIASGFLGQTNPVKSMMHLAGESLEQIEENNSELISTLSMSVTMGVATLHDQSQVNLIAIQEACNNAFQQTGLAEHAMASDNLSKLTGLVQGGRGEWLRIGI
jgi:hypothetical protein